MESLTLLPKPKVLPNLDALPLIREIFQNEFEAFVPSKQLSQNILTSLQYEKSKLEEEKETFRSFDYLENLTDNKDNLIDYAEKVFEAYVDHEQDSQEIRNAEKNIFESQACYLHQEMALLENKTLQELMRLKRQPLFGALDFKYVKKYKLLQGEASLPPNYKLKTDFQVKHFTKWRRKYENVGQDNSFLNFIKGSTPLSNLNCKMKKQMLIAELKQSRKLRRKKMINNKKDLEILRAEPKIVFFTHYKLGDIYVADIDIKNVCTKGMQFQIKPTCPDGPFSVKINDKNSMKIFPGLSVRLTVEFTPKTLDNAAEDIIILIKNGRKLLIPLVAYLEPPILKTHKDVDEYTRSINEKIASSYIECGTCFSGDTKITKLRFRCYRGCGEFFIMSSENWNRCHINAVTHENFLEIPPYRVYPAFFKMEKNDVIDLFVEFFPKTSGMHVENIVIACNNGEIRSLDLLADAMGWHNYHFSFQDSLQKELPVNKDDDIKVKYYLDFGNTVPTGKLEKIFCVSNNSDMSFEFQWKIREANINGVEKYRKLSTHQVKIDPESGTFKPKSVWEFLVTINLNNADIGEYRMVLSLYVLNLPYQCIEEDKTIIQPTGLVRNLYSQSVHGEEEGILLSPEILSLQGTYESLQGSIKSYIECQSKAQSLSRTDFCKVTSITNAGLCPKPLKKSKTYVNIGDSIEDEGLNCPCRHRQTEAESVSESCTSNSREKINESLIQKSEVIWDFVDILVNEVEVWIKVSPIKVSMEPSVIEFSGSLNVNEASITKQVEIFNYNLSSITCTWLELNSAPKNTENLGNDQVSVSLLFDNVEDIKNKEKFKGAKDSTQAGKQIFCCYEKELSRNSDSKTFEDEILESLHIDTKPVKSFIVPGLSKYTCSITVSALRPGKIKQQLRLSVNNGELELVLLILGNAYEKPFEIYPEILDFGILKQGTRYTQDYKLINKSLESLFLNVNQYKFHFKEEKFVNESEVKEEKNIREDGILVEPGSFVLKSYYLDAREPGIRCTLLEAKKQKAITESFTDQYILILGDVRHPVLSLFSPRFENAILAPSGMMYVGQTITSKVFLTNNGNMDIFFTWGHSFGCHSRKINVDIIPRSNKIERKKKMEFEILLTPLDEGIISHCYIPCFFCRSVDPLILSVIGISENINITFEIIENSNQAYADTNSSPKTSNWHTILRVPWPLKMYNLNLGKRFIGQDVVLSMKCQCAEVEEEVQWLTESSRKTYDNKTPDKNRLKHFKESYEHHQKISNNLKNAEKCEDFNDAVFGDSDSFGKSTDKNTIQKYYSREPSLETLELVKFQLEFFNVPYRTPICRQFVIRNETPVATTFQINPLAFGAQNTEDKKLKIIKDRILGNSKDEFKAQLPKYQPLVIIVEPSKGELLGFDAVPIKVFVYGNTWGEYRDYLICEIKGVEVFHLKLFVQIVGHPICFPMFAYQETGKPVLRFQPVRNKSKPISKKIKVLNKSAIPVSISWIVFLNEPLDEESSKIHSNEYLDSNHSGEESTKSAKVYIAKNASENVTPFRNLSETKDLSHHSGTFHSVIQTDSAESRKKGNSEFTDGDKNNLAVSPNEDMKSETLQFPFLRNADLSIFQVKPKEMDFSPFEEKNLTVIFNPNSWYSAGNTQEFKAVLTGCVKLNPKDEKDDEFFYRPCGMKFVSEILDLNAIVESPLVSFEILKGDLKFAVDANEVIKSKQVSVLKKFLIKNQNQSPVELKLTIIPGVIFRIKSINTIDKFYRKYNPNQHSLKIEPGQLFEVELECLVSFKNVLYAYEQLKLDRKKDEESSSPDDKKTSRKSFNYNDMEVKRKFKKEPWLQNFNYCFPKATENKLDNVNLGHKDSFQINLHRMSSKSDNSLCYDDIFGKNYYGEVEGEFLELPQPEEWPLKPKKLQHVVISEEEINFVQEEFLTQTLLVELHLSFPALKVSPKNLDFGNVYIEDTATRYSSLINLTGFPAAFKMKPTYNVNSFTLKSSTGSLPAANYNSGIGTTVTVNFRPTHPGYFRELFQIYCNTEMEFDCYELFVCGYGTWNEKYKAPKVDIYSKLPGIYPSLSK